MRSNEPSSKASKQVGSAVDLTTCDRERIHELGAVQAFGCLIAVSSDWLVTQASANLMDFIGVEAEEALGRPLAKLLPPQTIHDIRTQAQLLSTPDTVNRIFGHKMEDDGDSFDISIHRVGKLFILEFQRAADSSGEPDFASLQRMVARLKGCATVEALVKEATRCLRAISGYDHVMVYRFNHDDSGDVIAEAKAPQQTSYLGLRFPATDIPKQARALYLRSLIRVIGDVDSETAPILPQYDANGQPLDLSMATTRAVSPIHLQYLRNMGVAASMSVSIVVDGRLWGLFACHHDTPLNLDFRTRTTVELFVQLATFELTQVLHKEVQSQLLASQALHQRLLTLAADGELIKRFSDVVEEIGSAIAFDGIAISVDDAYVAQGVAPTQEEFADLARFLNTAGGSEIYVTEALGDHYRDAQALEGRIAGILALPISRSPRDYIVLFRREVAHTVRWGGNPEKAATANASDGTLQPRSSFAQWKELVRGRSSKWSENELRAAEAVRITLLEIILKISDAANAERKRAAKQQELLIAELNHRVRNILSLIRSLLRRSNDGADSEAFKVLSGRIFAVARAHDQLTSGNVEGASAHGLVNVEMAAFADDSLSRVYLSGKDMALTQTAFTCLALVIHELVTNAAKYGALSNDTGRLDIKTDLSRSGDFLIKWRETGGPPAQKPTTRGFGSAIIERTIPHELGGKVELRFEPSGLEADIVIPKQHLLDAPPTTRSSHISLVGDADAGISGRLLLVEDNAIIALDASENLLEAGADDVVTVSSVAGALAALENGEFDAAILDINLGTETSEAVAEKLRERGIPFILATGYDAQDPDMPSNTDIPVLKKPYRSDTLIGAVQSVMHRP